MSFKNVLKWVFLLFCIIFTFQVLSIILVIDTLIHNFPVPRVFSSSYLSELALIALASALPTLILTQCKALAWMPMIVRRVVHFVLTFGIVCGFLVYFGWYDISLWLLVPFVCVSIIYVPSIIFYERHILAKRRVQQSIEEQEYLQYYTEELEQYKLDMKKFKHDYQNIIFSLESYINEGDLAGLQQYYYSSLKPASDIILKDNFALDGLEKIKIGAIKSVLTAKLTMAQNANSDLFIKFEASEDIDHIPLDTVALVRMLGIILDNAVEELIELGYGELFVSCLKVYNGIAFVVQNTCRSDMLPAQQLWEMGVSTKGENRGLGLFNLSKLADAYPNVTLSTKISESKFVQEIWIESYD